MVVYDRSTLGVIVSVGNSSMTDNFPWLQLTLCFVPGIGLFIVLLYLISLKRKRVRAEEWLETHNDILFGTTWGSMSEIEILESLVKNRGLAQTLANPTTTVGTEGTGSGSEEESSDGSKKSSDSEERKTTGSKGSNSNKTSSSR